MPANPLPTLPSCEAVDLLEAALVRLVNADRLLRRVLPGLDPATMGDAQARTAYRHVVDALDRADRARSALLRLGKRLEGAAGLPRFADRPPSLTSGRKPSEG